MDTPYASGTESLASQIVVEVGDGLLCQVRQRRVSNAREDVAIDQIAVSTLGVAVPFEKCFYLNQNALKLFPFLSTDPQVLSFWLCTVDFQLSNHIAHCTGSHIL